MIKRATKEIFGFLGLEVHKTNSPRFNALGYFGIPYDEWERRERKYFLKLLNISVGEITSPLIIAYQIAKRIVIDGGGIFSYDNQNQLLLTIKETTFYISYPDELFVINEVFVSGDYNFKTKDEYVVIDIGLNIGATALFFSKQPNVRRIYAYELFEPTYRDAQRNIEINSAANIQCFNVGLGKENGQIELPYSATNKARMGLHGLPHSEIFPDTTSIVCQLVDVALEITRISKLEPGRKILCKMDCEGAEFEILERLFSQNVIDLIDFYIIEWHYADTQPLETKFLNGGFNLVKSTFEDGKTGLIYATKGTGN